MARVLQDARVSVGVLEISELRGPDNFQDWEAKVKIHLERFGLEGFLNAAGLRELENDFEKKTLFYFRKLAAYLSLRHSIGPVIDEVKKDGRPDCRSEPHRLWEAIGKAIKRLSAQQASEFVQDLLSVDHDNYGSGWAYIHRLNYLVSRLQGMGVSVDEKVLQPLVLAGIKWWKPEWAQSFKEKLESGEDTYEKVIDFFKAQADFEAMGFDGIESLQAQYVASVESECSLSTWS